MKKFLSKIAVFVAVILLFSTAFSCGEESIQSEYVIQYTDDAGVHSITVTTDALYSLDEIPEKHGYDFIGLFETKTGGRQYVDENGNALFPFRGNQNTVLFPHFKAKEYTLVLDYQGAPVTGDRSMTVSYDSLITNLPLGLELEHKTFLGWFTKPSCDGVQVADRYGEIPMKNLVNETVFDLSGDTIYLYAGFETEKHTVVFNFGNGVASEEIQVAYGSDVKDILYQTRVGGNGVLTWSTEENDEDKSHVFTGKIIEDTTLYAVEFAPVIEFNVNGGKQIAPIIATANTPISLPIPQKEDYLFVEWLDNSGNVTDLTAMPTQSITLSAKWQAKLIFDENGGSDVQDVSKPSEESIVLPAPQKDGFIFAGWYTQDKSKYESTAMPSTSVHLKAGWYKALEETVIEIPSNTQKCILTKKPSVENSTFDNCCYKFNYSHFFPKEELVTVTIKWHVKLYVESTTTEKFFVDFYSEKTVSSNYLLGKEVFNNVTSSYKDFEFTKTFDIKGDFYSCWYGTGSYYEKDYYIKDYYYTVIYPDITTLYL
ncbi:MAG: InlB B-repeat-containing protein [Clostridia bacterium]|nr:InlB B-repeat-containing protein [Clostridia bacterium]